MIEPAPARGRRILWSVFLKTHGKTIAANDFFTVEVWSWRGLVTHYILFVIDLAARRVVIVGITTAPPRGARVHGALSSRAQPSRPRQSVDRTASPFNVKGREHWPPNAFGLNTQLLRTSGGMNVSEEVNRTARLSQRSAGGRLAGLGAAATLEWRQNRAAWDHQAR